MTQTRTADFLARNTGAASLVAPSIVVSPYPGDFRLGGLPAPLTIASGERRTNSMPRLLDSALVGFHVRHPLRLSRQQRALLLLLACCLMRVSVV